MAVITRTAALPLVVAGLFAGCAPNLRAAFPTQRTVTCKRVKIGASRRCLIAGKPCDPRYARQYARHGFRCKPNVDGRYRLWKPIRVGPTKPRHPKP